MVEFNQVRQHVSAVRLVRKHLCKMIVDGRCNVEDLEPITSVAQLKEAAKHAAAARSKAPKPMVQVGSAQERREAMHAHFRHERDKLIRKEVCPYSSRYDFYAGDALQRAKTRLATKDAADPNRKLIYLQERRNRMLDADCLVAARDLLPLEPALLEKAEQLRAVLHPSRQEQPRPYQETEFLLRVTGPVVLPEEFRTNLEMDKGLENAIEADLAEAKEQEK